MSKIEIRTADGVCPAYVYRPQGAGPWPAVLVYMDALAIRPAMLELGQRLATHGYFVLLPDLFYRVGPYAPMEPREVLGDEKGRSEEHTSELQSLMRISYAVFCLKKKKSICK